MHLTIVVMILAAFGWTLLPREESSQGESEEPATSIEWKSER